MKFFKNLKKKHDEKNEQDAREKVLEELFNDFNRSRFAIYRLNFVRGIFFGPPPRPLDLPPFEVKGNTIVLGNEGPECQKIAEAMKA